MALNPQGMLAQLSPARGLDLSGMFGSPERSMARQQLALARERFEEEKRQAQEQKELEELKVNAQASQQAALREKERIDREATVQAELLKQQQGAMLEAAKLGGSGKAEQLSAMAPYFDQLGIDQNELGRVGGLPVFEFRNRAQRAAEDNQAFDQAPRPVDTWDGDESATGSLARLGGMGYPTNERGRLDEPAGIGSTEDAFARAQAASSQAELTGKPARGPDEEDFTGAVPRNVIDMPAEQAATLARLRPMLGSIQESYPTDYQGSASKTANAVMGSGLGAVDSLALFKDLRQSPDELIKAGIQADAQKEQFREKRDQFTPKDIEEFKKSGWGEADSLATKNKIPESSAGYELADKINDLLDDDTGANDTMIAADLMNMQVVKGTPSDRDLEAAFGTGKMSFIDQVFGAVQSAAQGGFSTPQRDAIKSYVKRTQTDLKNRVFSFLDSADKPGSSFNEHVKLGFRDRARQLVSDAGLIGEYEDERSKKKHGKSAELSGSGKSARGGQYDPEPASGDFDIELESQAMENDLDPDKIKRIIGPESGGRANARNKDSGATGLIQFLPSIAERLGTSTEELAKMSSAEQLPFVMRYFSERGVTSDSPAEDYAMAVAAPNFIGKAPETVVYPKGSKAWEQNPAWRPQGGGDITVGSIQAYYDRGSGKGKAAASKAELPAPTTAAEKRMRELMEREGR